MKLVGGRRVFSVEEVTARLAGMFEDLRSFWVEAELQDLRPARSQVRFSLRGEHLIDASMNGVLFERIAHRPANGTLVVPMAGRGQVPARATGVVVNVTATGATSDGYLTTYPCGTTTPTSSTRASGCWRSDRR